MHDKSLKSWKRAPWSVWIMGLLFCFMGTIVFVTEGWKKARVNAIMPP